MWVVTVGVVVPANLALPVGGESEIATWLAGVVESFSISLSIKPGYRGLGWSPTALRVGDRWVLRVSFPCSF